MLHIQKEIFATKHNQSFHLQFAKDFIHTDIFSAFFSENRIFFDIETTGLSPASSCIYLIGCMYQKENSFVVEQFFAETKTEENEILVHFLALLENYQTLLSFNGIRFDLPFLASRCKHHGIVENFTTFSHIDIFQEVKNMKHILNLPNYKQKTIEKFLDDMT